MAKVIGFDEKVMKQFTCHQCGAIVQYAQNDVQSKTNRKGTKIKGLNCPNCYSFHRTNP
jgi:transcription initiation factor IIE alpha subunit